MSTDWRRLFLDLYKEVADCEAPEGTQVDDALATYQPHWNAAQSQLRQDDGHVHHVDAYGDPVPAETYAVKCDGGEDCPDRIGEQEAGA